MWRCAANSIIGNFRDDRGQSLEWFGIANNIGKFWPVFLKKILLSEKTHYSFCSQGAVLAYQIDAKSDKNLQQCITSMLRKLLSRQVAILFNGQTSRNGKKHFNKTKLYQIIKGEFFCIFKFAVFKFQISKIFYFQNSEFFIISYFFKSKFLYF